MKATKLIKQFTFLASASIIMICERPIEFSAKVAERGRQLERGKYPLWSWPFLAVSRIKPPTRRLNSKLLEGEVTAVLEQLQIGEPFKLRLFYWSLFNKAKQLESLLGAATAMGQAGKQKFVGEHRVLHVLTNSLPFTHSGYSLRTQRILESQVAEGITVRGLTRLGYPLIIGSFPRTEATSINGITYARAVPWLYRRNFRARHKQMVDAICDEATAFGATVLHTTTDFSNALVVSWAAARLGIPWVYEVRGQLESTWLSRFPSDEQEKRQGSEYFRRFHDQETNAMKAASALVVLSEVSKADIVARGVPASKIHVIPNAVESRYLDKKFNTERIRENLHIEAGTKLAGSITSVVDYEGLDTLIESLTFLPEMWRAVIVGDGTSLPALREKARRLGVEDRLITVGRVSEQEALLWYAALDVFVIPRKNTRVTRLVTPIKPLIAMALKKPIVASDLPALREVTGGKARYFPAGDAGLLSQQLLSCETAEFEYDQALSERTWERNGHRYLRMYDSLYAE